MVSSHDNVEFFDLAVVEDKEEVERVRWGFMITL